MRGHLALAQFHDEVPSVEPAIGGERHRTQGRQPVEHGPRCEPFGVAGGAGQLGIDHEPVPVLHQHVPDEAELRFLAWTLAVQPSIGIGDRSMAVGGAPFAVEVAFLIPSRLPCRAPTSWSRPLLGGSPGSCLGRKLFIDAHASTRLLSTLKCSLESRRRTRG
jgi:hypothetical protein